MMAFSLGPSLVRSILQDGLMRRLAKNVGFLSIGIGGAALLGFLSLALTARALGPQELGVIALLLAYVNAMNQLLRPENWQALIKYGAGMLEDGANGDFKQLVKFGLVIDMVGGILAMVVAMIGLQLGKSWSGWNDETVWLGTIFCLIIPFKINSTPTAVLRLFNRFGAFAVRQIAGAGITLALVLVAYLAGAGLWAFLFVYMAAAMVEALILMSAAWSEMRARKLGDFWRAPLSGIVRKNPGIWGFLCSANLSLLIRKSTKELDVLIIGSLLGTAPAGLYYVARRLGEAIMKLGRPVQQAIYADAARLWARGATKRFRQTLMRVNGMVGVAALGFLTVVAFQAEPILTLAFGSAFVEAAPLLITHMASVTIFLFGITLRPALFSMGRQHDLLGITVVAAVLFYACLFAGLPWFGALAASIAHVVFNTFWLLASFWVVFCRGHKAAADPETGTALTIDQGLRR